MTQSEASLVTVEEWRRKSHELFCQSNDGFHSLLMKGFDSLAPILLDSDRNQIRRALRSLGYETKVAMEFEDPNANSERKMTFGFIDSVHLTFCHVTDKNDEEKENFAQLNAEMQKKLGNITNENTNLMGEVDKLKLENEQKMNENLAQKTCFQDTENELRSELAKKSTEINQLNELCERKQKEKDTVQMELKETNEKVTQWKAAEKKKVNDVNKLAEMIESLKLVNEQKTNENVALKNSFQDTEDELRSELAKKATEVNQLNELYERNQKEKDTVEMELKSELAKKSTEINQLNELCERKQKEKDTVQMELKETNEKVTQWKAAEQKKLDNIANEKTNLVNDVNKLTKMIASLTLENEHKTNENDALKNSFQDTEDELRWELSDKKDDIDQLKVRLESVQRELKETKQQMDNLDQQQLFDRKHSRPEKIIQRKSQDNRTLDDRHSQAFKPSNLITRAAPQKKTSLSSVKAEGSSLGGGKKKWASGAGGEKLKYHPVPSMRSSEASDIKDWAAEMADWSAADRSRRPFGKW